MNSFRLLSTAAVVAALAIHSVHALTLPVSEDTAGSMKNLLTKTAGKATTLPVALNRDGFVRFEVGAFATTLQANNVTGARLILYLPRVTKAGALTLHAVTTQWSEAVTINAPQPAFDAAVLATVPAASVVAKQFVIIDLTTEVKAWLAAPASDFGLAIVSDGTANVLIGAKEGSGSGYPAVLDIDTGVSGVTSIDGAAIAGGSIGATQLASNLTLGGTTSGTFNGNGSALTHLAAANIDGQLVSSQLASNLTLGGTTSGTFSGNGSALTNLAAAQITGQLGSSQLGSNLTLGGTTNGVFGGNGAALTNLNSAGLTGVLTVGPALVRVATRAGGIVIDVAVAGKYAYVAERDNGLHIYDISTPANPVSVALVFDGGFAAGVRVAGSYAYVANGPDGLRIYDISNPASPFSVGHINEGFGLSVAVAGSYAYLSSSSDGVFVYDVSNPSNPVSVAHINDGFGFSVAVALVDHYAYVANRTDGLRIYDVINPASPVNIAQVDTVSAGGLATDVAVAGQYAYVAADAGGLLTYNISDPANPVSVGHVNDGGIATGLAVAGTSLYLANDAAGLRVYDLTNPANPVSVAHRPDDGTTNKVTVSGDYAYVANSLRGLRVYTLKAAAAPAFAGDGSALTALSGGNLTDGSVTATKLARDLFLNGTTTGFFTGDFSGTFVGDGSQLSNLQFNAVTAGTNGTALVIGAGGSLATSGTGTIAATSVPASGLTGATLAGGVTASSLTSLGTLSSATVSGLAIAGGSSSDASGFAGLAVGGKGNVTSAPPGSTITFSTYPPAGIQVGSSAGYNAASGWGRAIYFHGGPNITGGTGFGSDNSDPEFLARFNVANDQSELRMGIGDGADSDKFAVGTMPGGTWTPRFSVQSDGTVRAAASIIANASPDLAETIPARADVEAGDVVCADPTQREHVARATKRDGGLLGVISDGTGSFLINARGGSPDAPLTGRPLVLAGRVPVKVSLENGPVAIGDYLAPSSMPGVAMRAPGSGSVVGIALEAFTGTDDGQPGRVLCFVKVGESNRLDHERVEELRAQMIEKDARMNEKDREIADLHKRVDRLEQAITRSPFLR